VARSRNGQSEVRSLRARRVLPLSLVVGVLVAGTAGYAWLWRATGGSVLDALYMTVITITTVGYARCSGSMARGRSSRC
jgi:hypothetical protein